MNAEIVWRPQPRQAEFMRRPEPEALYGGAAGGGKSDALVIEALRQVHIPYYRGLILRKTYPQLSDLVDKSMAYYKRAFPTAQYNTTSHVWVFPSGAKIYFGSMQYTKDRTNYQGKAFDFIGFDELTHFEWEEYSYMMSRNRPTGPGTRVYLRATTNPGGVGHGWVKARFITPAPPGTPIVEQFPVRMPDGTEKVLERARVFIPSSVFDNPALLEAVLQYICMEDMGINVQVTMPYADSLKYMADWFCQLWAESLGKNVTRKGMACNHGQTPVKSLGVTDQHSQLQLYTEGPYDKVITFLKVENFRTQSPIPHGCEEFPDVAFLGGKSLNQLIEAERQGTEYALYKKGRMSQTITLPEVNAHTLGQLIFFYEMTTAYTGELLDIDAFNQPGVEESKIASYAVLGNTSEKYQKKAEEMKNRPAEQEAYIL